MSEDVEAFQKELPTYLARFKELLSYSQTPPDVEIGKHCSSPYDCSGYEQCWKRERKIPDFSVFDIFGMRGKDPKSLQLYRKGILKIEDIPDDFKLTENQAFYINSHKNQQTTINKDAIGEFLDKISYPLYHLDILTLKLLMKRYPHKKEIGFLKRYHFSTHYISSKKMGQSNIESFWLLWIQIQNRHFCNNF